MGDWTSKRTAALLLRDLWRLTRRAIEFPRGDLTVGNTLTNATKTATELADHCGGVAVVGRFGAGFSLNGDLLPAASIQFRDFHRALGHQNIDSIKFRPPVPSTDLADLVSFIAGTTLERPTSNHLQLNDVAPSPDQNQGKNLTVEEMNRFISSVNEQRQSDDSELDRLVGPLTSDEDTRHYQDWVERMRHQHDTATVAYLKDRKHTSGCWAGTRT